jgi:mRNA interferase MazF
MKRDEIHLARLDPVEGSEIGKTRPVVIVSDDLRNQALQTVVVCPLTSQLRPQWRSRLRVRCAGKDADIAVDQIRVLSKSRLIRRIDRLSTTAVLSLRRLISEMYGEG